MIILKGRQIMFEKLIEDDKVKDCYLEIKKSKNPHAPIKHDLSHALNVVENIESILTQLGVEKDFIDSAKISALLHDIGMTKGNKEHALNSYIWAANYFKNNNMILPYHTEVLHAIRDHTDLYNSISLMTRALILADRLDITQSRLTDTGKKVKDYEILQHILNINVRIRDDKINVDIKTDQELDLKTFENISCYKKLKEAVQGFAKHQNLEATIKLNNKELELI